MKTIQLNNGIKLAAEQANTRMFRIHLSVKSGPAFENAANNGVSHFVEHMLFKGTSRRTNYQIEQEVSNFGSEIDAWTNIESTDYSAECLTENHQQFLDILSDIIKYPLFLTKDINNERDVILEEYRNAVSDADILMADEGTALAYQNSPRGQRILGTPGNIRKITRRRLEDFHRQFYVGSNICIAVISALPETEIAQLIEQFFGDIPKGKPARCIEYRFCGGFRHLHRRDHAKTAACLLFDATADNVWGYDDLLMTDILNAAVRRSIREDHALAYVTDVSLIQDLYNGELIFCVEAAAKKIPRCIDVFLANVLCLMEKRFTAEDLQRAKASEITALIEMFDSLPSRVEFYIRQLVQLGDVVPIEYLERQINNITAEDIQASAKRILRSKFAYLLYGRMNQIIPAGAIAQCIKEGVE